MQKSGKINVMHIILDLGPGGAERVVLNYLKWHTRSTFRPHVCILKKINSNEYQELKALNVHIVTLNKKKGLDIKSLINLAQIIRKLNIDILHLHNFSAVLYGTLASFYTKNCLIFSSDHNVMLSYQSLPSKIKSRLKGILGIFHERIIAVSDMVLRSQIKFHPYLSHKYIRIYNGIDKIGFSDRRSQDALKKELNLQSDNIVITKIASMYPQKGHEIFFKAAKILINLIPSIRLLVVGDGPRRKEIEKMVNKMNLTKHVILTGIRKDINTILSITDVFTLSSHWEGLPITILEAMSAGIPVVATDVGGNCEAILHGKNGYLVRPGDYNSIAVSIIRLLKNKALIKQMSITSKNRYEKYFTAKQMVEKTENIYVKAYNSKV